MLDIIKLRIEAGDTELLNTFRQIEKHLEAIDNAADGNAKSFKKMTDRFESDLKRVNSQLERTKNQSKGGSIVGDIITANVAQQAIGYIGQIAKAGFDIATNFEKVKVTFENAFGDKDLAKAYLDQIQQFAAKTPFEFDKLAESILKLKNRGFQPTVEELTKLGDLAATTGKDFDQLAEAVLDAQTGEFERLKEFGIRASKANGQVTLAFRDQTISVKDNDKAIREAIINFGALNGVQGAMAVQADTVNGQISNLKDNLSGFARSAGDSLSGGLKDGLKALNEFLGSLDTEKIFAFFAPIRDKLIPAITTLYETLRDYTFGITDANSASEIGGTILEGLQRAISLVVDAFVAIIDVSSAVYKKFQDFNETTGILTAIFNGLKTTLGFLADAFEFVFEGISKLALGQEAYNKRIKDAKDAELERAKAAEARRIKDAEGVKKLEEQQKQQDKTTASTKGGTAADKDAEKAAKERVKSLEDLAKAIQSFEDKLKKAKVSDLKGSERIEAERQVAIGEINATLKGIQEKGLALRNANKNNLAIRKQTLDEEAQAEQIAAELIFTINSQYNDQLIKLKQDEQKQRSELANKTLDEQIKIATEEGRLEELKLQAAKGGNSIYTIEEQVAIKRLDLQQRTLAREKQLYLESLGFKNVDGGADAAPLDTRDLSKENLARIQEYADREAILQKQIDKQKYDNQLNYLDRADALKLQEVEILKASGNEVLSLEQFKESERLRIQLQGYEARLALLKTQSGDNSYEIKSLELTIKAVKQKAEEIGKVSIADKAKNWLKNALGLDEEGFNSLINTAKSAISAIGDAFRAQQDLELQQLQDRQSILDEQINQTSQNIQKEQELKDRGLRNNLEAEQANLAALQAEKKKAADEEKKIRKEQLTQQLIADELSAASAIATGIAGLIGKELGTKGILGLITAGIGVIGMIALYSKYKSQVKGLTKLEHGGSLADSGFVNLRGRSDKFGRPGHRIEDSNIVVGGSEYITNEVDSVRYENVLTRVNAGKLRRKPQHEIDSFVKWMDGDPLPKASLPSVPEHQSVYIQNVMANPANKDIFSGTSQENRLLEVVKGMATKIDRMSDEISDLKKITAKRPIITPIPGGYMETIGNNTTLIKLKQTDND